MHRPADRAAHMDHAPPAVVHIGAAPAEVEHTQVGYIAPEALHLSLIHI